MEARTLTREERARRRKPSWATLFFVLGCGFCLAPLACGSGGSSDNQLDSALSGIGHFTPIHLDTVALSHAVQAGQPVELPFQRHGGDIVDRQLHLTLRNLRSADLTEFVLKDGDAGSGSSLPLSPPATYQGVVEDEPVGVGAFTITDAAVEGSMLVFPDGWSFIEPLEPELRLRGVDPAVRQKLLKTYNHIVYNALDSRGSVVLRDDIFAHTPPGVPGEPQPPTPLVMSIVADGDAALFRAYPLDSVMPFWLKQETLLNAVDWLYNCIEPAANGNNAYASCGNDFDGGSNGFQARLRIDRLEVWTTGGPDSASREELLLQSIAQTHQAMPPCCGSPHTAGRSNLVHFFSGRDLREGPGVAAGIGGLDYYGDLCSADNIEDVLCHHAVSQLVPGREFRGTALFQQLIVAHEIGHNNGAAEQPLGMGVCWLFGTQCGGNLMGSLGFTGESKYLYTADDARSVIGRLLAARLGGTASNP